MMGRSFLVILSAAVSVTFYGCPCVEGTWGWFASEHLPTLTRPGKCGTRMMGTVDNSTTHDLATLGLLPPVDTTTTPLLSVDGPVEENASPLDFRVPLGSFLPDHPWPWFVRIGNTSAGVLVSHRHVITLVHCVSNFTRWFGGYYSFGVQILDQIIEVPKVEVQSVEDNPFPLALLTLREHNLTEVTSVCVGNYREGFTAAAVTWETEKGYPMKYPVTVYPRSKCESLDGFRHDLMLCGSTGPLVCGSPLLQEDTGRWLLVGLATGDVGEVAEYVHLGQAREWLRV